MSMATESASPQSGRSACSRKSPNIIRTERTELLVRHTDMRSVTIAAASLNTDGRARGRPSFGLSPMRIVCAAGATRPTGNLVRETR
jgi:hypothetical protein